TLVSLYVFVATRAAHGVAVNNVLMQVREATNDICRTIANSVRCELVNVGGKTALKCTMPEQEGATDARGNVVEYIPKSLSPRAIEQWGVGKRIWFYQADATGVPGTTGTAVRVDDAVPSSADVDRDWSYYYGSTVYRWNLITSATFTVNPTARRTSVSVTGSVRARGMEERGDPSAIDTIDMAQTYTLTMSRESFWLRWRK
ncbi:MAG: hypothetical protein C4340_05585, partial [Armatimonadota bacterium]